MDNKKDDYYYIDKIFADLGFIISHSSKISYEDFCAHEILVDSMMFRLIQISENSGKLTESFKAQYHNIPWHAMKGLRNRIVHNYGTVDLTVIYNTIVKDIPELYNELKFALE